MHPAFQALLGTSALLLMGLPASARSGEPQIPLIQPQSSTLVLQSLASKHGLSARFSGKELVSGRLSAEWIGGAGSAYSEPLYQLVLDGHYGRELPHFKRYPVTVIEVTNGKQALNMAVGTRETQRLLDRRIGRIEIRSTFLIDRFEVGVECDAPWAKARIVSIQSRVAAVTSMTEPGGC